MKIIRIADVPKEDSSDAPIFFGGAVSRQDLVTEKSSKFFNFSVVNFDAGAPVTSFTSIPATRFS